jgi:hypothetical protein
MVRKACPVRPPVGNTRVTKPADPDGSPAHRKLVARSVRSARGTSAERGEALSVLIAQSNMRKDPCGGRLFVYLALTSNDWV